VHPTGTIGLTSVTNLTAGAHTLKIYGREVTSSTGPKLDKIIVTDNPNYDPRITQSRDTGIVYKMVHPPRPSPTP
jgi:hypothetical protein